MTRVDTKNWSAQIFKIFGQYFVLNLETNCNFIFQSYIINIVYYRYYMFNLHIKYNIIYDVLTYH